MNALFEHLGYRPNPGQARFHASPARFKCGLAGIGGGKTTALCAEAVRSALFNPGTTGMIVAPTWDMLLIATMPAFLKLLGADRPADELPYRIRSAVAARSGAAGLLAEWSPSRMCARLQWIAGGRTQEAHILFRSAGIPDHLRGTNLAWFAMDEAARCDPAAWNVLLGRVRVRRAGRPAGVCVSTPAGYDWLYDEFAGPRAAAGGRDLIRWRTDDNDDNLRSGYAAELRAAYSPAFAAQELDAEFVGASGAVFAEFRRALAPAGNLIRLPDRRDRPTWLGLDFGFRRPAAVWVQELCGPEAPDCGAAAGPAPPAYVVVDEFVPEDCPIDRFIAAVRARPYPLVGAFGDPAGAGRQSTGDSDIRRFAEAGICVRVCRDRLRSRVLYGIQLLQSLVLDGAGRRRLLLSADAGGSCRVPTVLAALERYAWPAGRAGPGREEPVKDGTHDHPIDALRYWAINAADRPEARIGAVGRAPGVR